VTERPTCWLFYWRRLAPAFGVLRRRLVGATGPQRAYPLLLPMSKMAACLRWRCPQSVDDVVHDEVRDAHQPFIPDAASAAPRACGGPRWCHEATVLRVEGCEHPAAVRAGIEANACGSRAAESRGNQRRQLHHARRCREAGLLADTRVNVPDACQRQRLHVNMSSSLPGPVTYGLASEGVGDPERMTLPLPPAASGPKIRRNRRHPTQESNHEAGQTTARPRARHGATLKTAAAIAVAPFLLRDTPAAQRPSHGRPAI
jgi:hypothetical protein